MVADLHCGDVFSRESVGRVTDQEAGFTNSPVCVSCVHVGYIHMRVLTAYVQYICVCIRKTKKIILYTNAKSCDLNPPPPSSLYIAGQLRGL